MRLFISLLLVLGLSACSQTQYREMQTATDDLAQLKTFSWETTATTGDEAMDAFDSAFRDSMSAHLQNKGYQEVADKADMKVDYRISIMPASAVPAGDTGNGIGWHLDDAGQPIYDGWNNNSGVNDFYQRGLVILTLSRSNDKKIVWQAAVARVVDGEGEVSQVKQHASRMSRRLGRSIPSAK